MRIDSRRIVVFAIGLMGMTGVMLPGAGCTRSPLAGGPIDLAAADRTVVDLAVVDLAAVDLAVVEPTIDLARADRPADLTVVDLAPWACEGGGFPGPIPQKIVFEIEYVNWAWGYQCAGRWIDAEGNVSSYDYGGATVDGGVETCPYHQDELYTEAELLRKYGHKPKPLCTIDRQALLYRWPMIAQAAKGQLSPRQPRCADFGGITNSAYVFDAALARYRRVVLRERGDDWMDNLSQCGGALADWLFASCASMGPGPCR